MPVRVTAYCTEWNLRRSPASVFLSCPVRKKLIPAILLATEQKLPFLRDAPTILPNPLHRRRV